LTHVDAEFEQFAVSSARTLEHLQLVAQGGISASKAALVRNDVRMV